VKYDIVIGLEIHVALLTESKFLCSCATAFGAPPNTQCCPVCLGLPGALPLVNEQAVEYAVRAGLALNCEINHFSRFDRKNYFYPDLPKAYQITQDVFPICTNGYLEYYIDDVLRRTTITRLHLEEEAGKLVHSSGSIVDSEYSLVDYNRAGIPLIERVFGFSPGGLFSPEYLNAPWSFARFVDMLKHLPVPIIVIGASGMASLMRVMRSSLLDEIKMKYVTNARAKGLKERVLLFRYPVRVALNPILSSIGWMFPQILSGATITAIVLNLPTVGALMYRALLSQDMYLAGTCVLFLTVFTLVGTFISDILLVCADPRIRFD
jgi:hypothetical protein